jgi:hypothetical protein
VSGESVPDRPAIAPPHPPRSADIAVTIILLVVVLGALVLFAVFGILLEFLGADSPGDTADALVLGIQVFVGCFVLAVIGIVVSIIFMVRRRLAWWLALTTLAVIVIAALATLAHWTAVIG